MDLDLDSLRPFEISVQCNRDELALLDWVLLHPTPTLSPELDWHMGWRELRKAIWRALYLHSCEHGICPRHAIVLSDGEANILLALIPTTFRWGHGDDCGFSLKLRVLKALEGIEDATTVEDSSASPEADPCAYSSYQPSEGASS